MDYSPPSSSVHGILQARILAWAAIPFSRGSPRPRDQTKPPAMQAGSLPSESPEKPLPTSKLMVPDALPLSPSAPQVTRLKRNDRLFFFSKKKKKDVLSIIGDWNAKVRSQGKPGVTSKIGLGVQHEAWQKLTDFCQENTLIIANTLLQQQKRQLYTWTSPDGQY